MILRHGRSNIALALGLAAGLAVSGCTSVKDRQGYVLDETLIASVQPGVDNRDSVLSTLGRPSFTGQFNANDWYYVSRNTQNLAFNKPNPVNQTILRVRFDEAGNVLAVDKAGMERVASIDPSSKETPTLGRDRGILEELFGNIGAVGARGTQQGGSTDNPN